MVQRLQQSGRAAAVRTVGVPGSWRGIYGGDAGQLALVPQDAAALLERASWTCAGCGLGQADRACPFCQQLPAQPLAGVGPDPQAAR